MVVFMWTIGIVISSSWITVSIAGTSTWMMMIIVITSTTFVFILTTTYPKTKTNKNDFSILSPTAIFSFVVIIFAMTRTTYGNKKNESREAKRKVLTDHHCLVVHDDDCLDHYDCTSVCLME